jgi:hypothetical protein
MRASKYQTCTPNCAALGNLERSPSQSECLVVTVTMRIKTSNVGSESTEWHSQCTVLASQSLGV